MATTCIAHLHKALFVLCVETRQHVALTLAACVQARGRSVLSSAASFELAAAAARTSADETDGHILVLCEATVSGTVETGLAADPDGQIVCHLDLSAGNFVILVTSQTLLSGSLRHTGASFGIRQRRTADASAIGHSPVLRQQLPERLLLRPSTATANMPLSKQVEAHGWAAQLEASIALEHVARTRVQSSYGFVPGIRACAALAAPQPAPDRPQPYTVQASTSMPTNKIQLATFVLQDRNGMQQLQAAGLAIALRRAASSAGWLRSSTAPALATAWRPIAMPPASMPVKPAKWLIISRRPIPLTAICTLPSLERASIQTINIVYHASGDMPHDDGNTIVVSSDAEALAVMADSRANHIFCICDTAAAAKDGGLEAEVAAAAMLWAFRARARCSMPAKMSLITFGQQTVGCNAVAARPAVAAAMGALVVIPSSVSGMRTVPHTACPTRRHSSRCLQEWPEHMLA